MKTCFFNKKQIVYTVKIFSHYYYYNNNYYCYYYYCYYYYYYCTPASAERSIVLHLILVTLAGDEIQLPIELQEFDRFNDFENAVLENLPLIGMHTPLDVSSSLSAWTPRKS